jgi:hypothetical protein
MANGGELLVKGRAADPAHLPDKLASGSYGLACSLTVQQLIRSKSNSGNGAACGARMSRRSRY